MPDWLNRTSKKYLQSVPSYELPEPESNYILYPDMSAVQGWASRYWIITGDVVTLADQATRDAIDAAIEVANRDKDADGLLNGSRSGSLLTAFAKVVADEVNLLRQQFNTTTGESNQLTTTNFTDRTMTQLRNAVRAKLDE